MNEYTRQNVERENKARKHHLHWNCTFRT